MSPEEPSPGGQGSEDVTEDELRKILGDDYESVVGKEDEAAGPQDGVGGAAQDGAAQGSGAQERAAQDGGAQDGALRDGVVKPGMVENGAPIGSTAQGLPVNPSESWSGDPEDAMVADAAPASFAGAPGRAHPAGSPGPGRAPAASTVQQVHFGQLDEQTTPGQGSIDVLLDVTLPISVELGRTEMEVKEILRCGPGTVIELSKLAGEPVDVFINGRLVAQGEVVVVDEHFGVRVTNLLSPSDRVRSLA